MFLIFLFSVQTKVDPAIYKVFEYTEKKKDPAVAFVLSTTIPSAGHFYAHKPLLGLVLAGAEIIEVQRLLEAESNDVTNDENVWYFILCFTKIVEIFDAMNSTSHYNRKIKEELGIKTSVDLQPQKIGVNIAYQFE